MKRLLSITALIVTATLTINLPGARAERDDYYGDSGKRMRHEKQAFFAHGSIYGTLKGEVRIGGKKVFITEKTEIYDTTGRPLPHGYRATGRYLRVSGFVGPYGDLTARMVIVKERSRNPGPNVQLVNRGVE